MDWDGNVLEEESYDYDGPIAHAGGGKGGGGGDSSSYNVQTVVPWAGVQPGLNKAYAKYSDLWQAGGPQYYPGQDYVTRDPLENYAQNMNLAYATQSLPDQIGQARYAQTQMLNAPNVASNPYVGGMADVIQKRMSRNFRENIAPRLESGAMAAGQKGGSREAILQGRAARDVTEATGDALANLYGQAYGQGLDQQARGMALAPQTAQFGMMPMNVMSGVGDYRRQQSEQALQSDINRWGFLQEQPYSITDRYLSALNMAPWGQASSGKQNTPGSSPLANAVGGGMLGYSAYAPVSSALMAAGPPGAMSSALLGLGPLGFAAGGALLGGLFG